MKMVGVGIEIGFEGHGQLARGKEGRKGKEGEKWKEKIGERRESEGEEGKEGGRGEMTPRISQSASPLILCCQISSSCSEISDKETGICCCIYRGSPFHLLYEERGNSEMSYLLSGGGWSGGREIQC